MPPRNHSQWLKQPKVEHISSEAYNSHYLYEQEQELIFSKVWVPMCHISEMYNQGDYRTTQIAGQRVVAWNTGNGVKAYLGDNITSVAGNMASNEATGKELHCEVYHGGMVWVTLNDNPDCSVDEWLSLIHI